MLNIRSQGGKILNRNELLDSIVSTIALINRDGTFQALQKKLKGENILLFRLFETGGKSTPGALAEFLEITASRVTAIIHALEHKELVCRVSSGTDRRKVIVEITEKGKKVVEGLRTEALDRSQIIMDKIGENDTHEFLRIMNKIIEIEKGCCKGTTEKNETPSQPEKEEVNIVE